MRIVIKKNESNAVIITFHTHIERFDSDYERSKFFRELHGWKQVVPGNEKSYSYRRSGFLDEVPHMKIADSVFMVAQERIKEVVKFFDEWENKVDYDMMHVKVVEEKIMKMLDALD